MSYEEAKKQWGVDGMPADKQRLAKAMYEAGQRDMREKAAAECQKASCKYAHPLEHLPIVDCIDAIRAIKLESEQ